MLECAGEAGMAQDHDQTAGFKNLKSSIATHRNEASKEGWCRALREQSLQTTPICPCHGQARLSPKHYLRLFLKGARLFVKEHALSHRSTVASHA